MSSLVSVADFSAQVKQNVKYCLYHEQPDKRHEADKKISQMCINKACSKGYLKPLCDECANITEGFVLCGCKLYSIPSQILQCDKKWKEFEEKVNKANTKV